jgi:hypothetical protein
MTSGPVPGSLAANEAELAQLRAANAEAIKHHPGAPQLIPQFRDIYMVRMLEHLCGKDLEMIQLEYERAVNQLLGDIGKQMMTARLLRPGPEANGRYTPPKQ